MLHNLRPLVSTLIILAATGAVACPAQTSQPGSESATPALDPQVDKILTRLENRKVHDLRARLKWEVTYEIEEDEEPDTKLGAIWYMETESVATFKVHFDSKISGNRRRKLDEQHLFDGRWYVELQEQTKTVTRREIRAPGDTSNPYKVGEGPFPLPFGQKKADILREFSVTRVAPSVGDPPNTDHVRLIPRAETNSGRSYKALDFWVAGEGPQKGLPIKVLVDKKEPGGVVGSHITISFSEVELNPGFSTSVFKIDTPAGYQEIVERLEEIPPPTDD